MNNSLYAYFADYSETHEEVCFLIVASSLDETGRLLLEEYGVESMEHFRPLRAQEIGSAYGRSKEVVDVFGPAESLRYLNRRVRSTNREPHHG